MSRKRGQGARNFLLSGETWCAQVSKMSIRQRGKHVVHRSMGEWIGRGGRLANVVIQADAELFFSPHSVEEHVALTGRQRREEGGSPNPPAAKNSSTSVLHQMVLC